MFLTVQWKKGEIYKVEKETTVDCMDKLSFQCKDRVLLFAVCDNLNTLMSSPLKLFKSTITTKHANIDQYHRAH